MFCSLQKLLFLWAFVQNASCSVSELTVWELKSVNGSVFSDPLFENEDVPVDSEIKCALIANKKKWPNVLYFDSGICRLATVDFASCQNVLVERSSPSAVDGKWLIKG